MEPKTQFTQICCTLPEPNPDFVGREKLFAKVEEFIQTHTSGYLVIVGGMGMGKSAFMAELIHRHHEPVYHIIDYHPSATGDQEAIASCLYKRLKEKHNFPEPDDWQREKPEVKLERILKHISINKVQQADQPVQSDKDSQTSSVKQDDQAEASIQKTLIINKVQQADRPVYSKPEVLFIDAADQAEASIQKPLIPGALRSLPSGVVCIISSRTDLAWLRTWNNVTRIEMDEYIDDRADVEQYLKKVSKLPHTFINKIVTQSAPPVFLTIIQRLRDLDGQKDRLLSDPSLWVVPPEELVDSEAIRMVDHALMEGIDQGTFWKTLGLLALAREALNPEHLEALGLWENETEKILRIAANFFQTRPITRSPQIEYHFQHPGYHRAVLDHLTNREIRECHSRLAQGCSKCWNDPDSPAHSYSLNYLPSHLQSGRMWDKLCHILMDFDYLQARVDVNVFDLLRDFCSILDGESSLPSDHPMRDQVIALHSAIDSQFLHPQG